MNTMNQVQDRVSSMNLLPGEEKLQSSLRPTSFKDYTGQKQILNKIAVSIAATKKRGEVLDHTLLYGPPGLGKTSLANVIAKEIGTNLVIASAPSIKHSSELVGVLTKLKTGDVLFIDEIHRLPMVVEEFLYSAMEDFKIDFLVGSDDSKKTLVVKLNRFTLIGATTRAGDLSAPLRDRFGLVYHMNYYEHTELAQIIVRSASILKSPIDASSAMSIAKRSRGTPRIANRLLKRVRDYADVHNESIITEKMVDEALVLEGIDQMGLDQMDKKYLDVLNRNYRETSAGIEAIASMMSEEVETLEEIVEPYLLKLGLIVRTKQGRTLTIEGMNLLKGDQYELHR